MPSNTCSLWAPPGPYGGGMTGPVPPSGELPVVALVASAGGLDALTRVLAPLPVDLPASVLVLQHVSPDHVSILAEILDRKTALAVRPARDGDELTPAVAYVA